MVKIRDNVYQIKHSELGSPTDRGWCEIAGEGKVLLDAADVNFINTMRDRGYEPVFTISRAPAMGGEFVVIARQWNNHV